MIEETIQRYNQRLKTVYAEPSPYYSNPLYEYSEIKQKIKELRQLLLNLPK